METGSGGDFGEREALALELEQITMSWRAEVHKQLPELIGLCELARARLARWAEARLFVADKRLFVLERQAVLATVIEQVVVGYLGEVGPQVFAVC